jgi:Flp pilus assembly protein TadD
MQLAGRPNRRRWLPLGGLLIVYVLSINIAVNGWAQNGQRRTGSINPVIRVYAEGVQTALSPSRTLEGQIEDALARGNLDSVRMLVPKFLAEPSVSADTLMRTGVNLAQHELFLEAAGVFGRCVEDSPALFDGYYDLALAELALQKYLDALATIQKAPRASPRQEVAREYLRGKIESAVGQDAQAEQDLASAFAAAPQEENYALDLGLAYIRAGKYQPARDVFEKAGRFQKDSPFVLLGLSLAQLLGGQNAEAIETCHSVLSLHPDSSPVRVLLAFALSMQGNVDEAVRIAAQGLQDPAPFPYLYYIHATALLKQESNDYDIILKDLALAERSIPQCSLCYLAQSKAHQQSGERDAAIADLDNAVELDSSLAEAWYRLGLLYDQEGRHAEAREARRRFAALKENKADRETEMLRDLYLKALSGEGDR